MAMPQAVRHINEARVLEAFHRNGPMSRADLARELAITRSTASRIVASLLASGVLVEETDSGADQDRPARSGRPSIRLALRHDHATFLGADIAYNRVTVALLDLNGRCQDLAFVERDHAANSPEEVADQVCRAVHKVFRDPRERASVRGLNVSVPGLVDFDGNVHRAPVLGWNKVPLRQLIQARLPDIAVHSLENDANAFAFADLYMRDTSGLRDAVYLLLVDGVGGCIVSNGQIIRGHNGYAGEIGYIRVGEQGLATPGMIEGSLESFVGREPLLKRYHTFGGDAVTIRQFADRLRAGDPAARRVLHECSIHLGRGLAILTTALNPEKIIFGGELADVLLHSPEVIVEHMAKGLLPNSHHPQIERSVVGVEASAVGVALMLHQEFFSLDSQKLFGLRASG